MATAYGKVSKGTGFEIPKLDDDLYDATVADVQDSTGSWQGESIPQYMVKFDLEETDNGKGEPIQLAGFIRIPQGVIDNGTLNEKSKLYEFLLALGYTDDDMEIDPGAWQGQRLRVMVENKEIASGDNKGQVRPRITNYKPPKGKGPATRSAQPKAPVAAGARRAPRSDEEDQF